MSEMQLEFGKIKTFDEYLSTRVDWTKSGAAMGSKVQVDGV